MKVSISHPIYGTLGDYEPASRPTIRFDHTNLCPMLEGLRFNCSLAPSGDGYLFVCRNGWKSSDLYAFKLDGDFQPTGYHRKLEVTCPAAGAGREDPRWFRCDGQLYISFVGFTGRSTSVLYARINEETLEVERVYWPQLYGSNRMEKNHGYFDYEGQPHAVYTINPHQIIKAPLCGPGEDPIATREYVTPFTGTWLGGMMRGGASPVLHNGEMFNFFHGCTRQENGRRLYNCSLYTFSPKPPFQILRYMPAPFDVADPSVTPDNVPVDVIFPGSATLINGQWAIAMGVADSWSEVRFYDAGWIESLLVGHNANT